MNRRGFTIVELLIVIVVIAMLAAISIVAFTGVQQRARDTQRKSDLSQLAKAIRVYQVDRGDYAQAGCGNGSGSGWLHSDYDGAAGPNLPINTCLINAKALEQPFVDPSGLNNCDNGAGCNAYMKASCAAGTWVLANLETLPQNATFMDDKCFSNWDTSYGINYAVKVD
jgi:prepilin-type N-terminal cleavage/methylation domain-containing protein